MATPILATKLYIPPPPPRVVVRRRLIERLDEGQRRKLTLISAPAGFGKSTLVSEWSATGHKKVAWLSLDEGDSDPARFLIYLITALQTVAPLIGQATLGVLQSPGSPRPPAMEPVLTALLNETSGAPDKLIVVLDDYHVIDASAIDDALTFLLEHLPSQMHVVMTTREDPQLPLARLRARDQLTELRAADLRFTPDEAATFLNQVMGLDLSVEDIDALETRTEGWIAGLQLAALSMQGHGDVHGFVRAFAGDHRYIVDYLVEEVLQRQPESLRSFLLQTSILDRLCGPLCAAVTGQAEGGSARLEALERGNFFVVALDDKRHWYRYHHLFAEVLHSHLAAEQPEMIATLHRRASEWYEQHGSAPDAMSQAIRHALAAEDFERAADLAELAVPQMRRSREDATMLGWLKALPDALLRNRPSLSVWYAHTSLAGGELESVEARLRDAERWLDSSVDRNGMVIVDEDAFRRLPSDIAVARAGLALVLGDVPATVKYARQALQFVPEDDLLGHGAAAALLGLASWAGGDLETAHRAFAEGMASLQRAGHITDVISGTMALADLRIAQGRLHEAMSTYERALQLAMQQTEQGALVIRGTSDLYVGMGEIERERNDLDAAHGHLLRGKELGEHSGFPPGRYRCSIAMSRIKEAQGDRDGALNLLGEAERLYLRDFFPNVRPVAAMKARQWAAQGRLGEALGWAREQGLSVEDELSYLREFEHMTLARVLLALYKGERNERSISEAVGLLERLLKAAEEGGRTGSLIEILVLQALTLHAQGEVPAALAPLQRALTLAEPEGYVRTFVDEGTPMLALLEEAEKAGIAPGYIHRLLAAFGEGDAETAGATGEAGGRTPDRQDLVEPLSVRELEVLRLLRTELTGPEIAHELTVSLHTIRTHTNNIYNKVGVNNRRAAVRRAEEVGLL